MNTIHLTDDELLATRMILSVLSGPDLAPKLAAQSALEKLGGRIPAAWTLFKEKSDSLIFHKETKLSP